MREALLFPPTCDLPPLFCPFPHGLLLASVSLETTPHGLWLRGFDQPQARAEESITAVRTEAWVCLYPTLVPRESPWQLQLLVDSPGFWTLGMAPVAVIPPGRVVAELLLIGHGAPFKNLNLE